MENEITNYTCECGSDTFIEMKVSNEKVKVEMFKGGYATVELGKEKVDIITYICASCREDVDELNDNL